MIMNIDNLKSIQEIKEFLTGSQPVAFTVAGNKSDKYKFIEKTLKRFAYRRLKRKEKGIVIKFMLKISGYSRQQISRLIERFTQEGKLKYYQKTTNGFEKIYTRIDLKLLAELDQRHDTPNGLMVKKLCERAYNEFNEDSYAQLSQISVSHIYNLRKASDYKKHRCYFEKTRNKKGANIGERRKPNANGKPGYIRIDTVHQGDLDGCKGVYHINAVDEVTQFEIVVSAEKISENFLIPALKILLNAFPFDIINFHSDNGSEYINKTVARLLNKLRIEMTKSRQRKSNDNALAEGKNAAIVRKIFGYTHIPQKHANKINKFNIEVLNPYVNYHRPCLFPTIIIDEKGKEKKKYEYKNMMTPYEKLKSIPGASIYLTDGITFKKLDEIATKMTDNEAADFLQKQRKILFKMIYEDKGKSA